MVGTFRKFAHNRSSHRSKHQCSFLVENAAGGKRISPAAALHGVPPLETFDAVEHPAEPVDLNKPVRCPPPEKSIMLDGLIWRERIAKSFRRQNERISKLQEGEAVGRTESCNPGRREQNHVGQKSLFVMHSAPEPVVTGMVEESA